MLLPETDVPTAETDPPSDDGVLDLPALDAEDAELELDDAEEEVEPAPLDGDPFDDAVAEDVPLDVTIATAADEPSAVGDDAEGIERAAASDGLQLDDDARSLLGSDEDGLEDEDGEVGDLAAGDADDGGAEGVDDPDEEHVDELPALDGQDDDDRERDEGLDVAI